MAMAARKVTATDVLAAIQASNFLSAPGSTKNEYYAYSIDAKTTLQEPQTFGELPVRGSGENVVRLRDVARIELAAASTDVRVRFNGQDGVFLGIMGTPEANPIDVAAGARKELASIQKDLPEGHADHAALRFDRGDQRLDRGGGEDDRRGLGSSSFWSSCSSSARSARWSSPSSPSRCR